MLPLRATSFRIAFSFPFLFNRSALSILWRLSKMSSISLPGRREGGLSASAKTSARVGLARSGPLLDAELSFWLEGGVSVGGVDDIRSLKYGLNERIVLQDITVVVV